MKKILSLILVIALLASVVAVVACEPKNAQGEEENSESSEPISSTEAPGSAFSTTPETEPAATIPAETESTDTKGPNADQPFNGEDDIL